MKKLTFVLSLIAVIVAIAGVCIAIAAYFKKRKEEAELTDIADDDFDYYEAQVNEDADPLQDIVDDTHPQEHGSMSEDDEI